MSGKVCGLFFENKSLRTFPEMQTRKQLDRRSNFIKNLKGIKESKGFQMKQCRIHGRLTAERRCCLKERNEWNWNVDMERDNQDD